MGVVSTGALIPCRGSSNGFLSFGRSVTTKGELLEETRKDFFACEASDLSTDIVEGKSDSPGRYALLSVRGALPISMPVNGVVASVVLSERDFGSVNVLLSAILFSAFLPSNCFGKACCFGAYVLGSYVFDFNVLEGV